MLTGPAIVRYLIVCRDFTTLVPVVLATCTVTAAASPPPLRAVSPDVEHELLSGRLDAIESRLERLEADAAGGLSRRRAAEVRALVADVLADADLRASLVSDEPTAGWDDEFFIQSADGNYRVEVTGQLQARFVVNRRKTSSGHRTRDGFEIRRAKVKLDGHVVTPDLGFTVGTAWARSTNSFVLQSFNIRYRLSDEITVLIGRARPPLLREEQISSKRQLAVERSLVARTFRQTRTVGAMLRYRTDRFRLSAGVMDASIGDSDPADPDDPPPPSLGTDLRWRASARAELLLAGGWGRTEDFTSFPGEGLTVMLGGGIFYEIEDISDPVMPETKLLRWSADASLETGGATLFVSYTANRADEEMAETLDQFGVVAQAGLFVLENLELFGRYEYGDADGLAEELSVLTVGFNYYVEEHMLKLTGDVGYGLNRVDDFWSSRGAGWIDDRPEQEGQIVVRVQMQLLF